ncbi:MAG: hydroxymethylglutaryl-CoA reductase [Syntrophobacteraceae bacterium]|jgi:hydroxymethylglutaryl-CoA reductase (NADPH)
MSDRVRIPRDRSNDYTTEAASIRREFIENQTGASLHHVGRYSFDPGVVKGNIENFIGVVQMPIGIAGPVTVHGQYAKGDFWVPLATTEGTLVASYNRGMRVVSECGGVKTTVVEQFMQRAPVFIFEDAWAAAKFSQWLDENLGQIKAAAERTTSVGKLEHIQKFAVANMLYVRVNYSTGDAAGQNMVGKATLAACQWIRANYPGPFDYILSGGIETDKRHSQMNKLHTRGKHVIAEATLKHDVLHSVMRADTRDIFRMRNIGNIGAMMADSAYNGPQSANGIASVFIATGQDEANVVESHAGFFFCELRANNDLYVSVTLPSLIVATYGGGTGLPTQRECLEIMGCYGKDKSNKLAEIVAAAILAGDISLTSAVAAGEWVSSHEQYGRNRPG